METTTTVKTHETPKSNTHGTGTTTTVQTHETTHGTGKMHSPDTHGKTHTHDTTHGKTHTQDTTHGKTHTTDTTHGKTHTQDTTHAPSHTHVTAHVDTPQTHGTTHDTTHDTTHATTHGTHQSPIVVSPDQEAHRQREAQELLHQLQKMLMEGESPALDVLSESLRKVEELTLKSAQYQTMDPETRKTLEDITALLVAARQLGRNKHISDRLQNISMESEKALKSVKGKDVSTAKKEATQNLVDFVNDWRPLFYLMTSSRDFRQLILDSTRIARRVVGSYTEDIRAESEQKFAEVLPAHEIVNMAKDQVHQKPLPDMTDEEWDILLEDIQKVLVLLAKEPTYREGIQRIFSMLDKFQKTLLTSEVPRDVDHMVPQDEHLGRVVSEAEKLVASFSGKETLEHFKHYLRKLMIEIQKNVKLRAYIIELKEFILKAKTEEEIRSSDFAVKSKELAYRGRDLVQEIKDKDNLRSFFNSAEAMVDNIKNDEFLQILRYHAGIVRSDLTYVDTDGKIHIDTDVLSKLQVTLLPILAESLKYIPLPRIHSEDKASEFSLDNIVFCSYDIIPENIRFQIEGDMSMMDVDGKGSRTYFVITLDKLLTELKDMEFFFNKKTFPKFKDSGRVTFRITGKGAKLVLTYILIQDTKDNVHVKIRDGFADLDISEMEIEFDKETLTHSKMLPFLTKMFKTQIRKQIEKAAEKSLTEFMSKFGDLVTRSLSEMNRPTPFLSGLEAAKKVVKSTQIPQVAEKRREKLE